MSSLSRIVRILLYTSSAIATLTVGFVLNGKNETHTLPVSLESPTALADIPYAEGGYYGDSSCYSCASYGDGGADGCDGDAGGDCGF